MGGRFARSTEGMGVAGGGTSTEESDERSSKSRASLECHGVGPIFVYRASPRLSKALAYRSGSGPSPTALCWENQYPPTLLLPGPRALPGPVQTLALISYVHESEGQPGGARHSLPVCPRGPVWSDSPLPLLTESATITTLIKDSVSSLRYK